MNTSDRKDVALAKKLSFGLMNLSSLPGDEEERRAVCGLVEQDLNEFFLRDLAEADRELWKDKNPAAWSKEAHARIFATFDHVICKRAEDLGWRIFESVQVRMRIQQWCEGHDRGVERLDQLFKAVLFSARRMRGEARAVPTDPAWRLAKKDAVPELRLLLRQHQAEFRQRRRAPSHEENLQWFLQTIATSAASLSFLAKNQRSLKGFLEDVKEHDQAFGRRLLNAEVNPGEFFDMWLAWALNLSPETVRQAIAKL